MVINLLHRLTKSGSMFCSWDKWWKVSRGQEVCSCQKSQQLPGKWRRGYQDPGPIHCCGQCYSSEGILLAHLGTGSYLGDQDLLGWNSRNVQAGPYGRCSNTCHARSGKYKPLGWGEPYCITVDCADGLFMAGCHRVEIESPSLSMTWQKCFLSWKGCYYHRTKKLRIFKSDITG